MTDVPPWILSWLSEPRLAGYLQAVDRDPGRALALYTWNGRVAAAFLRDLSDLEILVRNAYDKAIDERWDGDRHWLLDTTFPLVAPKRHGTADANHKTRQIIERATRDAGGPSATEGKIIAQLALGFWRHLTTRRREHEIWVPYLRHAFPAGTHRHDVDAQLERVRVLRNRIAHHEAIFHLQLALDHGDLLALCFSLSPDVATHVARASEVPRLLSQRP